MCTHHHIDLWKHNNEPQEQIERKSSATISHRREIHTMRREGANEGSTELYTASFGNTWCTNCFCELFYTWNWNNNKFLPKENYRKKLGAQQECILDQMRQQVHECSWQVVHKKPAAKISKKKAPSYVVTKTITIIRENYKYKMSWNLRKLVFVPLNIRVNFRKQFIYAFELCDWVFVPLDSFQCLKVYQWLHYTTISFSPLGMISS